MWSGSFSHRIQNAKIRIATALTPNQALEQTRDSVLRYGELVGRELLNFFVGRDRQEDTTMARVSGIICLMLVTCSCSTTQNGAASVLEQIEPQARPVALLLIAVQDSDLDLFKSAFSSRMQKSIASEGAGEWRVGMREYKKLFAKEFGDYRIDDFEFSFSGDARKGRANVSLRGRELPGLAVVCEGSEWKLDEK